jgi:type II secretory pathway component GspD/PulD (secretin)
MRMRSPRPSIPLALSPLLLAIAAAAPAAEDAAPAQTPPPAPAPAELGEAEVAAEAFYAEGLAKYRGGFFAEALELAELAVQAYPPHAGAQRLRSDVLAVLANRDDRLRMAAAWFASLQDVRTQETAVRLSALLERGDKAMAAGDYGAAELDYDRVEIGIRSFPYAFDWGELPKQVAEKRAAARDAARRSDLKRQDDDRAAAAAIARRQAELQAEALRLKVDELMRRAQGAFERKDYRRAEVEAWNAYELDRRREDARQLYLAARREGHYRFDVIYRAERLEGLARIAEEMHKSLIPQNELLVYPEDWQRRDQRTAREIGSQRAEPWLAALNDRLEQRVTFDFQDQSFEDVVAFLRQVTGVNIVVSPQVIANGGGGTVTLKLQNMQFRNALKYILDITGWHMAIQDQAIYISDQPVVGAAFLRLYDVTDLITPVRDFPGVELAYTTTAGGAGGGSLFGGGGEDQAAQAQDPNQLVDFIKNNVTKNEWDPAKNIDIQQRSGSTLFVSHTPEGHKLVEQLLANLRNQTALQVNVGVRLLDVRKGFFEEIGVEWHNNPVNMITANTGNGYGRVGQSGDSGYGVFSTIYQNLPGNATQAAYGITPAITPGGPIPKGLVLEGAMNAGSVLSVDQLNAIFSAAEDETDATILNHPQITCFNGQRANASFINQYAYISDYEVVSGTYDPVITILNYGDILDVRPVVSSDRKYVTMEIRPTNVALFGVFIENIFSLQVVGAGANGGGVVIPSVFPIELPNVQVQTLRSTVMLPDRGSLLIGGFNRTLRQRSHSGVPFLSHIPFLGRLFSRNGVYDESRKTFFLLSAHILDLAEAEKEQ